MATYKHLRSSTANKRPTTSIADGQLAINTNTASPGLFFKDSAGTGIVKVGPVHVGTTAPNSVPAAGGSSGNYLGEQWLDTSVSPAQMKVWNGSTWVGIVADELPVSKLQDGAPHQLIQTDAAGTGVEWTSNIDVPGTLDVTSTATFDSIASHPLGTAGAPTITFTGDTNTGIYSPGADQVAISTNGTGRLFVDANGNVGAGVSPGLYSRLAVNGNIMAVDGGQIGWLTAQGAITDYLDGSQASHYIRFFTNNAERMRLDSSGRLSLGTSSATNRLTISDTGSTPAVSIFNGSVNAAITSFSARAGIELISYQSVGGSPFTKTSAIVANSDGTVPSEIQLWTKTNGQSSPSERVRISSTGAVGIGTTSPVSRLDISGGADGTLGELTFAQGNATNKISSIIGTSSSTNEKGLRFNVFGFTAKTGIDITSDAFVGINKTGPASALDVNGDVTITDKIIHNGDTNTAIRFPAADTVSVETAGSERARIDSSGRLLYATSTARSAVSGGSPLVQIEGGSGTSGNLLSAVRNSNDVYSASIILGKTRGTVGTTTIVQNNDWLGYIAFDGADGGNLKEGASIKAEVDGTPGPNDMPGRLVFSTTADGASSPTERMRITSTGVLQVADAGNIAVGTTTGTKIGTATTQKLGFFNKTPVVQPTAVADATDAASVITQLNALLSRMRDLGLIAT